MENWRHALLTPADTTALSDMKAGKPDKRVSAGLRKQKNASHNTAGSNAGVSGRKVGARRAVSTGLRKGGR